MCRFSDSFKSYNSNFTFINMALTCTNKLRNLFFIGDTTVMAGIYGPVEVKMKHVLIDKASVECCYRPKSGVPGEKFLFE